MPDDECDKEALVRNAYANDGALSNLSDRLT